MILDVQRSINSESPVGAKYKSSSQKSLSKTQFIILQVEIWFTPTTRHFNLEEDLKKNEVE